MATSKSLPVGASVPCVISRGVPTVLTPRAELDADRQDVALVGGLRADAATCS